MRKRIILIGAIYYRNLGDAALCYTAQGLLSKEFEVTLIDIYGRSGFPPVPQVSTEKCLSAYRRVVVRSKLRKILLHTGIVPYDKSKHRMFERVEQQLISEIEREKPAAIVFAGGALIKGVFINSIVRIADLAKKYDIPVLFNAVGIDTSMLPVEWKKVGGVLENKNTCYISVRDGYDIMKRKFPGLDIRETFDSAMCANRFFKMADKKQGIGLGIMLSHNHDFYLQKNFWKELIKKLDEEKKEWKIFTNGSPSDQNFAAYLLKELNEREDRLVSPPVTHEDLYYNISSFEGIISMRLHSHILAYSSGTPSVAVTWDKKINYFFSKLGKPENCMDFSTSVYDIVKALDRSISDHAYFEGQSGFEQQVDRNFEDITDTIRNGSNAS